jgi:hypothetical protein
MKYLIDQNYNVITTADDDYEYVLIATQNDYPGSFVMNYIPKKPVIVAQNQPESTGTTPV